MLIQDLAHRGEGDPKRACFAGFGRYAANLRSLSTESARIRQKEAEGAVLLGPHYFRPTGEHFLPGASEDSWSGRTAPSSSVDDIVFAYRDREVVSTSLVSLLGSGPDNHTSITARFTLVLTVLQIISFPVPSRVRSPSVYCSHKARRSAHWLPHTLSGRGSVMPPPLG